MKNIQRKTTGSSPRSKAYVKIEKEAEEEREIERRRRRRGRSEKKREAKRQQSEEAWLKILVIYCVIYIYFLKKKHSFQF